MIALTSKQQAFEFCREHVSSKLKKLQAAIDNVKEALESETKSTAGDKHETGRAMLQLEREKLGRQLREVEKMGNVLGKIQWQKTMQQVALGSLVRTDKAIYFVSVSAGKYDQDNEAIFCISLETPIAQLLMGKTVGDTLVFNERPFTILELL